MISELITALIIYVVLNISKGYVIILCYQKKDIMLIYGVLI